MLKKIFSLILLSILAVPFLNNVEVKADIGTYNRTIVVDEFTNISKTTSQTNNLVMNDINKIIQFGGASDTTLYWNTPALYDSSKTTYSLISGHDYYIAVIYNAANGGTAEIQDALYPDYSYTPIYLFETYRTNDDYSEAIFTAGYTGLANITLKSLSAGGLIVDEVILIDLTLAYGSSSYVPTLEYLRSVDFISDHSFYVDQYNINDSSSDILSLRAMRTLDNFIENGDFSDGLGTFFTYGSSLSNASVVNGVLNLETTGSITSTRNNGVYKADLYTNEGNMVYISYSAGAIIDGKQIRVFYPSNNYQDLTTILTNYSYLAPAVFGGYGNIFAFGTYNDFGSVSFDNFIVSDLTSTYSEGNEPTKIEMDLILEENNAPSYFDSFSYEDNVFYELEMIDDNFFQYYEDKYGNPAIVEFALTETLIHNESNPLIYIEKFDLEGNSIGSIYDSTLTVSGQDAEGFNYYNFSYELPSPTLSEKGYSYLVRNGEGGNVITAGYVYRTPSTAFYTEVEGIREDNNAVGVNNSIYTDITNDYQFDQDNYLDYVFNDNNDNFMMVHYRTTRSILEAGAIDLVFTLENNTNVITLDLETIHYSFNPLEEYVSVEGYFPISYDNQMPTFLYNLENLGAYGYTSNEAPSYYNLFLTEIFDGALPDQSGFYTYYLRQDTGSEYQTRAVGETPIYAVDSELLYDFNVLRDEFRLGTKVSVVVNKYNELIDDIYNDQYIYDVNSAGIYDEGLNTFDDEITINFVLYEGLSTLNSNVYYYLSRDSDYSNGADNEAYDINLLDNYTITVPQEIDESINGFLDILGMGNDLGRIVIVFVLLIIISIVLLVMKLPFILISLIDIVAIAFFVIIGFIPLYIPLLLVLFVLGLIFIVMKTR